MNNKPNTPTLDLKINRIPISPLNKIDPKNNTIKNPSTTKTNKQYTSNKLPIVIKHTVPTTETSVIPSPQLEIENFENISEAELPTLGDSSSAGTTQPKISKFRKSVF